MKVYRTKRRSCKLCKPHKMGIARMWKDKVLDKLKRMERDCQTWRVGHGNEEVEGVQHTEAS